MKLYVKNKLVTLTGGSDILDENQQPVYKVKGKLFTLTNKKYIQDLQGNTFYIVRDSFFNFPFLESAFLLDSKGKKILKVKERLGLGYKIESENHDITIEGKVGFNGYNVIDNGKLIAVIRRQLTLIADAFEVEIIDAEDIPFVLSLVICIDNIVDNNDSK